MAPNGASPLRVGLVGAGPWAQFVHAPMLSAGPATTLEAIWARRPAAAGELANQHDTEVSPTPAELFARCDAAAFAVPPDVQAELAVEAALSGCALLLEKPIAADVEGALRLAEAVDEAGVASMVVLTWRYGDAVREFLAAAESFEAIGGAGRFIGGGLLAGPFMTPWRLDRGPLLDLGPHVIDLLDAALGPVVGVHAAGDLATWVTLQLEHESGVVSEATMTGSAGIDMHRSGVELYSPAGVLEVDTAASFPDLGTITGEFAESVRSVAAGGPGHPLDARRGLHLQRIIADAEGQLA